MERRIQAFENKCYRRMLGTSYREHKPNEYVYQQVSDLARRQELLLSTVKRCKLSRFGHVCRHNTMPTITLQETVDGIGSIIYHLSSSYVDETAYLVSCRLVEEDLVNHEGQHQGMDRPVNVVIVVHRR